MWLECIYCKSGQNYTVYCVYRDRLTCIKGNGHYGGTNKVALSPVQQYWTDTCRKHQKGKGWRGKTNMIVATLDKSSSKLYPLPNTSKALNHNIKRDGLCELWRYKHPTERQYSYYSRVHNTYSRMDFFVNL